MTSRRRTIVLRVVALLLAIMLAIALLAAAWAWLAGASYFLLNLARPRQIGLDTWWLYWQAYGSNPAQRPRLIAAALLPAVAIALPLALCWLRQAPRALYGDARWASSAEIRHAGLL